MEYSFGIYVSGTDSNHYSSIRSFSYVGKINRIFPEF